MSLEIKIGIKNEGTSIHGLELGLINDVEESSYGFQLGGLVNIAKESKGVQLGLINFAVESIYGFQVGLICYAKEGAFVQLGVLTIRSSGPWYTRITPIFGYGKSKPASKEKPGSDKDSELEKIAARV